MASRVHKPLKIIACNANGIARQRYERSKQLQDLHIDVALFSETHLKPYDRLHNQNYYFYRICRWSQKRHPHMHVDLPPLVSVEATGVYIPIGIQEILLGAVYKSPGRAWNDADITELSSFRHKCILTGDLNAEHPSWNSAVSNPSGQTVAVVW
jgi:hypothetical protein